MLLCNKKKLPCPPNMSKNKILGLIHIQDSQRVKFKYKHHVENNDFAVVILQICTPLSYLRLMVRFVRAYNFS